jgi:BirA family biotin operon repressor/biotin-[acetyl-CoA-carboxylase] ligase
MIAGLETNPERWIRLASVDSTNSYAMREHLPGTSVVLADAQSAGRGRMGRSWQASPGSVIFTGVLEFDSSDVPDERLALFAILSGVAVLRAAQAAAPGDYRIKEPNDVLVLRDRPGKIAGVLVESEITANLRRVFIGIGVNLTGAPPPLDSLYPPAALFAEAGVQLRPGAGDFAREPAAFAARLVLEINARLDQMATPPQPAFLGEALEYKMP